MVKCSIFVTFLLVSSTVCLAGYWEFEQVDSGSLGSYVAIDKTSDGTIWLAYVNLDSTIRLAHRGSVWEFEDLDISLVSPLLPSDPEYNVMPFSFDIGPGDVFGVVGLGRLAERNDSAWTSEELPLNIAMSSLGYNPEGRPSLAFTDDSMRGCLALKAGSDWDTDVVFRDTGHPTSWLSLTRPAWRRDGSCAFMEADMWVFGLYHGWGARIVTNDTGSWSSELVGAGVYGSASPLAALVDGSDSVRTFWSAADDWGYNGLVCDGLRLDSASSRGRACLDDSGRVQCTWTRRWILKFAVPGRGTCVVQDTGNPVWCDITTDTLAEPVIAFCRDDGSIWVARGVGIVGLSGEHGGPVVRSLPRAVTIVSGVLYLPQDMTETGSAVSDRVPRPMLLDACGRKVMDLHLGANDIGCVAPGVYFIVTPSPTSSPPEGERVGVRGRVGSATKIVIAR